MLGACGVSGTLKVSILPSGDGADRLHRKWCWNRPTRDAEILPPTRSAVAVAASLSSFFSSPIGLDSQVSFHYFFSISNIFGRWQRLQYHYQLDLLIIFISARFENEHHWLSFFQLFMLFNTCLFHYLKQLIHGITQIVFNLPNLKGSI